MRSPVSNKKRMHKIVLEEGLVAFQCPESEGIFLPVAFYLKWLSKQKKRLDHLPKTDSISQEIVDSVDAKICPESGQIMQRYRVGHDFSFYLDRSPLGSIWFDKGEWEALKARQYHDELHLIFTVAWQSDVRTEERLRVERKILTDRLGADLFSQLESLKSQLDDCEYRSMALAFLQD